MQRRKDNYSDGARSKKGNDTSTFSLNFNTNSEVPRHYSFRNRNPSPSDRFGIKERDAYRNIRVIQKNLVHVIGLPESLYNEDVRVY